MTTEQQTHSYSAMPEANRLKEAAKANTVPPMDEATFAKSEGQPRTHRLRLTKSHRRLWLSGDVDLFPESEAEHIIAHAGGTLLEKIDPPPKPEAYDTPIYMLRGRNRNGVVIVVEWPAYSIQVVQASKAIELCGSPVDRAVGAVVGKSQTARYLSAPELKVLKAIPAGLRDEVLARANRIIFESGPNVSGPPTVSLAQAITKATEDVQADRRAAEPVRVRLLGIAYNGSKAGEEITLPRAEAEKLCKRRHGEWLVNGEWNELHGKPFATIVEDAK